MSNLLALFVSFLLRSSSSLPASLDSLLRKRGKSRIPCKATRAAQEGRGARGAGTERCARRRSSPRAAMKEAARACILLF